MVIEFEKAESGLRDGDVTIEPTVFKSRTGGLLGEEAQGTGGWYLIRSNSEQLSKVDDGIGLCRFSVVEGCQRLVLARGGYRRGVLRLVLGVWDEFFRNVFWHVDLETGFNGKLLNVPVLRTGHWISCTQEGGKVLVGLGDWS